MVKFDSESTGICFEEIPDFISLGISITNCKGNCVGCHSPWLRENIGNELTFDEIDLLIKKNKGIDCVLFLGEGNDSERLIQLADYIKRKYPFKVALYSGRVKVEDEFDRHFDFIKIGPYIPEYGPLNKRTTNQRLYEIKEGIRVDITHKFWKN